MELGFAPAVDVGRRFTVGDHDDLLGPALAGEHLAGQLEPVLHVGAVDEVPAHLGQLLGGEHTGHLRERHQAHEVAGVLHRDQAVQRHRDLLGGQEVVAHGHRQRQVEHQHRGDAHGLLGLFDLEVLRRQRHR